MKFVPPGEEERRRAIGSLEGMPRTLRTFLQPAHFESIPRPGPNDWLANHAEPGQTSFRCGSTGRTRTRIAKNVIWPQALGKQG
jgi:hypothetical protein